MLKKLFTNKDYEDVLKLKEKTQPDLEKIEYKKFKMLLKVIIKQELEDIIYKEMAIFEKNVTEMLTKQLNEQVMPYILDKCVEILKKESR